MEGRSALLWPLVWVFAAEDKRKDLYTNIQPWDSSLFPVTAFCPFSAAMFSANSLVLSIKVQIREMVFRGYVIHLLMLLKQTNKQLVTQVIIFSSVTQQGNTFSYQCWFLLVTSQPSILNMTRNLEVHNWHISNHS